MRTRPAALEVLLLSTHPGECAPSLDPFRHGGAIVRVASGPVQALELLQRRPNLVFVDLVHGPNLSPGVVEALNRTPRASRVVAIHEGKLDAHFDQVEHLTVDGFCRLRCDRGRARRGTGGVRA